MAEKTIDNEYYEVARPGSIAERLMRKARGQIYADFIKYTQPVSDSTILDVGVSDVHSDGANWIEVQYPYTANISACGLGEAFGFREAFPDIRYTRIAPNAPLPYGDKQFDIATANAVLEHVGSIENQRFFVRELARVARMVFLTVPHRYFPIEHHTGIPLAHYSDRLFPIACRIAGKDKWSEPKNLILMSKRRLRELAREQVHSIGYTGLLCGPLSSNLFMLLRNPL